MKNKYKHKKEKKNINIFKIIMPVAAVLFIGTTAAIVFGIRNKINDRTVKIAFYGLSEEYCNLIKEKIPVEDKVILKFIMLDNSNLDIESVPQKYDMFFTWRGEVTDLLSQYADAIPKGIQQTVPMSLRNDKVMPLLLDHYEFTYYHELLQNLDISIPESYDSFQDFLNKSEKLVFCPFLCNGADNNALISFIGVFIESFGGVNAYDKLISIMRKSDNLDAFIDEPLDSAGRLTVRSVLDMLKKWPEEGKTHPSWHSATENDIKAFCANKQLGAFFLRLSQHRTFPYSVISMFDTTHIPILNTDEDFGIIAPSISCMLFLNNSNCKRYLSGLLQSDVQSDLSNRTMLAPVEYRAEAYDHQSDDVRFWAAYCAGGALPDLATAVYQSSPDLAAKIAGEIRVYLR